MIEDEMCEIGALETHANVRVEGNKHFLVMI